MENIEAMKAMTYILSEELKWDVSFEIYLLKYGVYTFNYDKAVCNKLQDTFINKFEKGLELYEPEHKEKPEHW